MIDTATLNKSVDLLTLIERDTEPSKGKRLFCPFCQVTHSGGPALQIYGDTFYCHGCSTHGDAIDYVMQRDQVDFVEACKRLGWDGSPGDAASIEQMKAERIIVQRQAEQERIAQLDALLAEYSTDEIWLAFQRRLDDAARQWWRGQGVPDEWQNYLRLGYTNDKAYYDQHQVLRHSAAYTIPYFHEGWEFCNMQYRLVDPANPKDRYRFQPGLRTTYYSTLPSDPLQDCVIICEGAKKAMVAKIEGGTGEKVSVLGVPSKTDAGGVIDAVKDCKRVWIVLDPDAWDKPSNAWADWKPAPVKLAQQIGKAARVVRLPFKSDDGFLINGMSADEWKATLKTAGRSA